MGKAEEIQIIYSERRYEPFWHVACQVRYVYDRTRSYNVSISASIAGVAARAKTSCLINLLIYLLGETE